MKTHDQYCRECGTSIPTGAVKCPKCEHRITPATQSDTRLSIDVSRPRRTQISRDEDQLGKYQMAEGFLLNTQTGDVWRYDDKSSKFKIVERDDSLLTSVEKAKTYIDLSEDIDSLLSKWDEKLSETGDDSQLANIDMQNMLQKQQQTIQMMSQISKTLHDTAMAVIRKIG